MVFLRKLLSLIAALTLLLTVIPAHAEFGAIGEPITYADYSAALASLSASYLNWELRWDETDRAEGYIMGNLRNAPLLTVQGDYVAMSYVSYTLAGEDADALADVFLIVSTLVAATPAVARGAEADATVNAVFAELQPLFGSLTLDNPTVMGLVDGNSCAIMINEEEDGMRVSMFLLYDVPAAN